MNDSLARALLELLVLAIPVAAISWTVTHEELFREPRGYCEERSRNARSIVARKWFYLLTCEYCFSHYVAVGILALTRFKLLYDDWRGYLISGFALVWIANHYMSLFGRLRLGIRSERLEIGMKEAVREKLDEPEPRRKRA
jgi:hypothetical protein